MKDDHPATQRTPRPASLPLYDVKDVASLLGVSVSTVRRLVRAGEVPAMRIRRQLRFDPRDIEAYLARSRFL